jgi:hypothetical protein
MTVFLPLLKIRLIWREVCCRQHLADTKRCPLDVRYKRTLRMTCRMSAFDPGCVKTHLPVRFSAQ